MIDKPWTNTGLGDFTSWLGATRSREGLVYRGDADFEQLGPRGTFTVIELKQPYERLSRGQLAWLRARGRQDKTEVRVVQELPGYDSEDLDREVDVWNPLAPWATKHRLPVRDLATWVDSRAYRPKVPSPTFPPPLY